MLAVEGVSRFVLRDVTLEVPRGALVALTGPNGAGKTTLLRLAAGLDRPARGRVLVGGHDARTEGPQARALVAFAGQEPALYDALTARENLAFVARFYGRSADDVARAAERMGVREPDARAGSLSRGERQRVVLARALLGGELMLLDEPTTALDDEARARLVDELSALRGERTILVATHDEELAKRCDARLRLVAGRLAS